MTVNITKPAINLRSELADLRKPTGIAGEAMLRAETPQEQFNLIGAGRRNLFINGDQRIAQRATSVAGVVDSGIYINDRMGLGCSTNASGTHTLTQSTDAPAGFKNSFKLDCTTANSSPNQLRLYYNVEGNDVSHLNYGSPNAQTLTLSFWVKSNVTGTYTVSIETSTAQRYFASHYTIDSVDTWEYKTIQIVGDTANTISTTNVIGLNLSFWLTAPSSLKQGEVPNGWVTNSSYTTIVGSGFNVNMASNTSNEWLITGMQLELGKVATPFEHRSYGEELALCQRYFFRLDPSTLLCFATNTTRVTGSFTFPTSMRAVPTRSGTNVTNMNIWFVANITGVYTFEAAPTTVDHSQVSYVYSSGTNFTSGTMHRPNGSFSIDYDAEL